MQTIKHGNWTFDYVPGKCVYSMTADSADEAHFVLNESLYTTNTKLAAFRKAGLIHKLVRNNARSLLQAGQTFINTVKGIEEYIMKLCQVKTEFNRAVNIAFPIGLSVNEIAAHDTAMIDDKRLLYNGDVVKCDIGIQIDGYIVDSAFTHIVGETLDTIKSNIKYPLLEATADATYTGLCMSGVDARLYEISQEIQEIIESYELLDSEIKAVNGLGGHDINYYEVHGEKLILSVPHKSQKDLKMEEGEVYAIETYASSGSGMLIQKQFEKCNHFGINHGPTKVKNPSKNVVVDWAYKNRHDLPFTQRWCNDDNITNIQKHLLKGVKEGTIVGFPPLFDPKEGSLVSQLEHTLHIKDTGIEIFSLGTDF